MSRDLTLSLQTQLSHFVRLFGRAWFYGEWLCILKGPGYRPQLLYRPLLPPRPAPDAPSAPPSVRLRTRMTRAAAAAALAHSILWLAAVFVVLSFPLPPALATPCCCCCCLSIVAGGLLLSAHTLALPLLFASHVTSISMCLSLRTAALAAGQGGNVARVGCEAFVCAHACVLLLLLLCGRSIARGVQPQLTT